MKSKRLFGWLGVVGCIILVGLVLAPAPAMAQTTWAHAYGGGAFGALAFSIQQTSDGGYIVTGWTEPFGADSTDFWVLKLDASGNVTWQRTYGGAGSDVANSIQQTSDGGYIVAGWTESFGAGSTDFWVLKLDASGNVTWQRTYGEVFGALSFSIQQTSDGGYIVADGTNFRVLKLDSSGNVTWQRRYEEGPLSGGANSIQQTSDGGYIVAGSMAVSFGTGEDNFWVLKLDASGNVTWQRTYGGADDDAAISIQQANDGGYIVAGWTESFGAGSTDFWVFKLDTSGNVTWQRTYGGAGSDVANSIQQTSDGGYIVAGMTMSFGAGLEDFWVLKLDSSGNVIWQRTYGGVFWDEANSIQQTSDGGYIVAGLTDSFGAGGDNFWVLKLDANGEMDPSCTFVSDTNILPVDSSAIVTDTSVTGISTSAIVTDTSVSGVPSTGTDTLICSSPPCVSTEYARGVSSIRFGKREQRDRASLRMCIDEAFCDALKGGRKTGTDPNLVEIVLEVDDCDPLTIPAERLKSNRSKTMFFARSIRGERPRFTLIIDCEEGWLKLRLRNADLKDCISNPVKTCVSITDGPCLCAEDEFVENRDRKGRLRKLFLSVREACLPTVDSNQ